MSQTASSLRALKSEGKRFSVLTAYDASMSAMISRSQVNAILVGDSLGMVVQGKDSTVPVTVAEMVYHTQMVKAGVASSDAGQDSPLIIADLPFASYADPFSALENSAELMRAGAHMVKLEGGAWLEDTIALLVQNGIPVCGHLGLTPQSVHSLGGYKVQGKDDAAKAQLKTDAKVLEDAGVDFIVFECIPASLAKELSQELSVSTIGIGAGADTDAQVLVCYDMLGLTTSKAKFVKNFMQDVQSAGASENPILDAINLYHQHVIDGIYPAAKHQYKG